MSGARQQPSPNKKKAGAVPALDWRELASGPALRGLTEVLEPVVAKPTVVVTPTVGVSRTVGDSGPAGAKRVMAAEESFTLGEERFYRYAWEAAGAGREVRTFTMGYDRLAKLVRLDEKSVRQVIPKLVAKKALEVVAAEVSSERIGKTYRIYSLAEILRRQREAGLEYIVKRGRAVEFVGG